MLVSFSGALLAFDAMIDEPWATTGLNMMSLGGGQKMAGRHEVTSCHAHLPPVRGLISNDLKQIGRKQKPTDGRLSLISIIRLLTAGRLPTPISCLSSSISSSSLSILTLQSRCRKTDGTSQSPRHPSVSISRTHTSCVRRLCLELILVTRTKEMGDGGPWEHRDWSATSELLLFFHYV